MQCSKCDSPMILRNGKYGKFWGCSSFPKCKNIVKYKYQDKEEKEKVKDIKTFENFIPSEYQQKIMDGFQNILNINGSQSMFVNACAGSGKTTTLLWLMSVVSPKLYSAILAFNKAIEEELNSKVPDHITTSTFHAVGYSILRKNRSVKINQYKVDNILKSMLGYDHTQKTWKEKTVNFDEETYKIVVTPVKKVIGLYKNTQTILSSSQENLQQTLEDLVLQYNVPIKSENENLTYQWIKVVLQESEKLDYYIDFDDMIFQPIAHKLESETYDVLAIDESQDLNNVQLELIKMVSNGHTKTVFVGDRNQSIYRFRGALQNAVDNIIETFNSKVYKLPLSYRTSKSVTRLINNTFPEIEHQCLPTAKEGEVASKGKDVFYKEAKEGDLVLCRINAPMIIEVYKLLKEGKKAIILGKDIGLNLINIISRVGGSSISNLKENLANHREDIAGKLREKGMNEEALNFEDQMDTLLYLCNEFNSIETLIQGIDDLFSDNEEGIVFATVHKAKGLEADVVYILRSDILEHPKGDEVEERNIKYVAYSRSKDKLFFIVESL